MDYKASQFCLNWAVGACKDGDKNARVCVLFKVVENGPKVEAEESVHVVGFVKKLLYLEMERGQLKQTTVLPGQNEIKTRQPSVQ